VGRLGGFYCGKWSGVAEARGHRNGDGVPCGLTDISAFCVVEYLTDVCVRWSRGASGTWL
jgi:hypothetical protein